MVLPFSYADFSGENAGSSSLQFLKLGAGARADGLGGAYGSVSEDASALYWNPAGLSKLRSQTALLMHAVYLSSIFYDSLSYALPIGKNGGCGGSVHYLSFGNLEETNNEGLTVGTLNPDNLALTFGGGYRWNNFAAGSSIKYLRARIKGSASTATADLALLYSFDIFTIGLSAQNIFSYITFDYKPNELPLNLKLSGSLRVAKRVLLSSDLNLPRDNRPEISLGFERTFELRENWMISPRAGYSSRTQELSGLKGIATGLGINSHSLKIDYAWVPLGDLGQTHRISMTLFWGKERNK